MIAPLGLAAFALVVNSVGSRWLGRASWVDRAPALGIVVWQVLTASVLMSVSLAGLALALPLLPGTASLATLLEACSAALQNHYRTPGGLGMSVAGAVLVVGVVGRIVYCLVAEGRTIRGARSKQRQGLALSAHRDDAWDISVVDHATPAIYCLPGRRSGVIVTTGARATLDDDQLRAVIAHERAHLHGRHDLVLGLSGALVRAIPRLACLRIGDSELTRLVEMRADDVALRTNDRITLARALVNLAQGHTPAGALGANGAALSRLHRLTRPPRPIGWMAHGLAAVVGLTLLAIPVLILAEPAAIVAMMHYCPLDI